MNNKKLFINKYDYLRSYTRCDKVNFLKNAEIEVGIDNLVKKLKNISSSIQEFEDEEDENDFDSENQDTYEEYRFWKLENETINLNDLSINKKEEIDPKIIEGIIIDKKAKEFISSFFKVDVIIDYDEAKYKSFQFDNLNAAKNTQDDIQELLNNKKTFILFQPTFINKTIEGSYYVTKCDAIVYLNFDKCFLIEVKGTTSSKVIHLMDFLFQHFVLQNDDNKIRITDYKLCLVKYCRAKKMEVPFILSNYCNVTKTAPVLTTNQKNNAVNENELIFIKQNYKLGKYHLRIYDILNQTISEEDIVDSLDNNFSDKKKITTASTMIKKIDNLIELLSCDFYNRINKLYVAKQKINKILHLSPCTECKSNYKNCEYWLKCRELFKLEYKNGNKSLEPFIYSGNIVPFKEQLYSYNISLENNIEPEIKVKNSNYDFYLQKINKIDEIKSNELWNLLQSKSNRVYFDFESINTAIRPMDGVFPFNQIITQNSLIKTSNFYDEYFSKDMIIDPTNINIEWIKSIIDAIYEGDNVWYIVYNKSFECTRLKEMDLLINEKEYSKKIKIINDNVFDLADFFAPSKNLILLNDLHGFYSIKKVLELIPQNILNETRTKSYHDLEVYNGAVAQEVTTKRFFNMINDNSWNHIEKQLQVYCQNDVRAMIAVEKFIKTILNNINN